MKKEWVEPRILVQQFVANEYVAACYKIKCTTPHNNDTYYGLYADTNGNGQLDKRDEVLIKPSIFGGFYGCNEWHRGVIRDSAPSVNGFVTDRQGKATAVFWWKEDLGAVFDYHVMTPGDENYETNPNAS